MKLIDKEILLLKIDSKIEEAQKVFNVAPSSVIGGMIEGYTRTKKIISSLEVKEVGVWKTVDNINLPQADKNKIYCVLSKNKYLLARVINHPHDDELLQWRCTEFPFHRYDMCEGDKYMQIV